jgi:hypothetical protein
MKRAHSIIKVAIFILISAITFLTVVKANAEDEVILKPFSQAELAQIMAPIALYPDTLLTHILIAATYPLEVVAAERWLATNSELSKREITNKSDSLDWDASVKALLGFPRVVKSLSNDLVWMQKVGDAFLQDETKVLASIQDLRQKADEAGNLSQMENVDIVREHKTIIIEPAQPEIVYVPYYDTRIVYGNWRWAHHQPIYWHRPAHFSYHHGPFYWQAGIHIGFDFFFSGFHWHNRHVVVHHDNRHYRRYNRHQHHSNRKISTSHQAKRWNHNPHHRKGVAYRSNKLKHKYHSDRPSVNHNKLARIQHKNKVAKSITTHGKVKYNSAKYHRVNDRMKIEQARSRKTAKAHNITKVHKTDRLHRTDKKYNNRNKVTRVDKFKSEPYADKRWQQTKGSHKVVKQKSYVKSSNKYSQQSRNKVVKSTRVVKQSKPYTSSKKVVKQSSRKQYTSSNKRERSSKGGQGKSSHRNSRQKHK